MAESKLDNWKRAYKSESWGDRNFGIEILVSVDRPLNDNDSRAMYKVARDIEMAIMSETVRLDPKEQENKIKEREEIRSLFGSAAVFMEEIPNGYCSQWCCTQIPWYIVTTPKGRGAGMTRSIYRRTRGVPPSAL